MSESDLRRQVDYYRRQLDQVAGENLRRDYEISGLRKELRHKRQAFVLLEQLQRTVGVQQGIAEIFQTTMTAITSTLGMDRTVIFQPSDEEHVYRPWSWTGFTEEGRLDEFETRMKNAAIHFPPEFNTGEGALVVNRDATPTPLIQTLRETFEIPFFVCVPVSVERRAIGLIMSGRVKETGSVFFQLNDSDLETFRAIAGLISTVVQNMRVAVLEETNRLKTDFFANISHEFRTPITLTLGPIEAMLKSRHGELPERVRGQLELIQGNQGRLLRLVNQILDIAKLEAGSMELQAAEVPDINAFVEARVEQFRPLTDKRGIGLAATLDPGASEIEVYLDPEKFDRVLLNLLSNALKFTKEGGIDVLTQVEPDAFAIHITDTGVGIPPEQLPYIFDRFRQADSSASREFAGTGIGLALVQEFTALHGGTVTVSSEVGIGTTFHLRLPLGRAHLTAEQIIEWSTEDLQTLALRETTAAVNEGAEDSGEGVQGINSRARRSFDPDKPVVLFVDDNRDLRLYVRDLLLSRYNVFLAVDGKQGLALARELQPDAILSDLMMPTMNGNELCQAIREDPELSSTPFILLTAKTGLDAKLTGLETGADDYLNKPFSEHELQVRLRNMIRLRQQQIGLAREISAAREIQRMLLGELPAQRGPMSVQVLYESSTALSGDFYDLLGEDPVVYLYAADVTSHGTAAAQVTYMVKRLFQEAVRMLHAEGVEAILRRVHGEYAAYGLPYDVGVQLLRIDISTGALEYAAGNAPFAVRIDKDRGVQALVVQPGPGLTAREVDPVYTSTHTTLSPGDRLYVFTDGCTEFVSRGRRFGMNRLTRLLRDLPDDDTWSTVAWQTLQEAYDAQRFDDDMTVLRIKWDP